MKVYSDRKRVLVVDDDPEMVKCLELYLRLEGMEVITANNGVRAIEEICVHKPGAMILDVLLPFMDGLEVCRRIRKQLKDTATRVIVLTGHPDRSNREAMFRMGANAYLTKPCDFDRIVHAIRGRV